MESESSNLHILMLPWLAMGHLLPFFHLSKHLTSKRIKISFISTPSNLLRLPPIPQTLTPFLTLTPHTPLSLHNLPFKIHNTSDLRSESDRPLLSQAYTAFDRFLIDSLSNPNQPKPNWIIYDFPALTWAPSLASRFNVRSALFCLFNAAAVAFLSRASDCKSPEEIARLPALFPFATEVSLRPFEARRMHAFLSGRRGGARSEGRNSELVLVRTFREFEAKWVDLIGDEYTPVGFIPPLFDNKEESEVWGRISQWLDKQEGFSVVYAAFGSEAELTRDEIDELRKKAREGKEIFGCEKLQEEYVDVLVKKLWEKREVKDGSV